MSRKTKSRRRRIRLHIRTKNVFLAFVLAARTVKMMIGRMRAAPNSCSAAAHQHVCSCVRFVRSMCLASVFIQFAVQRTSAATTLSHTHGIFGRYLHHHQAKHSSMCIVHVIFTSLRFAVSKCWYHINTSSIYYVRTNKEHVHYSPESTCAMRIINVCLIVYRLPQQFCAHSMTQCCPAR